MAIYNRFGAKVELISCHKTRFHDCGYLFVKAKRVSTYPDGTGKEKIGEIQFKDTYVKGWLIPADFTASKGYEEIMNVVEKLPEEKLDEKFEAMLLHNYWPNLFKKDGKPKKPNKFGYPT